MPDQLSQTLYNLGFGKMVKARDTANRMPQCSSFFKIFKRLTRRIFHDSRFIYNTWGDQSTSEANIIINFQNVCNMYQRLYFENIKATTQRLYSTLASGSSPLLVFRFQHFVFSSSNTGSLLVLCINLLLHFLFVNFVLKVMRKVILLLGS